MGIFLNHIKFLFFLIIQVYVFNSNKIGNLLGRVVFYVLPGWLLMAFINQRAKGLIII